jgi:hypothetical protein
MGGHDWVDCNSGLQYKNTGELMRRTICNMRRIRPQRPVSDPEIAGDVLLREEPDEEEDEEEDEGDGKEDDEEEHGDDGYSPSGCSDPELRRN